MHRPLIRLAHGTSRAVLLIGPWAVKFPTYRWGWFGFLRGCLANQSEQQWSGYQAQPPTLPLNQVVRAAPGGVANVYRRAAPYTDEFDQDRDRPLFGIYGDAKAANVGWVDGVLKILDYDMYCTCWQQCAANGVYVTPEFEMVGSKIEEIAPDDVASTLSDLVDDWTYDRTLSPREIRAIAVASSVFIKALTP